jgi:hypothetical protein
MTIVQGNEVNVYVFDEGEYKLYACGTYCSYESDLDMISIATVSTGDVRDYEAGLKTVRIFMDGVVTLDQLNKVQYIDLLETQGQRKVLKIELVNSWGDEMSIVSEAIAKNIVVDGSAEGVATYRIEWWGCGTQTINETTFEALLDDQGDPITDENGELIRV